MPIFNSLDLILNKLQHRKREILFRLTVRHLDIHFTFPFRGDFKAQLIVNGIDHKALKRLCLGNLQGDPGWS